MKKIFYLLLIILLCASCSKEEFSYDYDSVNELKEIEENKFDFDLHSQSYLLADMSELEVLYRYNTSSRIYPASLTKLFTLDTVLHYADDLGDTSYLTSDQLRMLIEEDSSLAGIYADRSYSLEELLYALILPSGGDAALALENYFADRGMDLVDLMNQRCSEMGCSNSSFTNTTGLHDDELYSCVDDIFTCYLDILSFEKGRQIMETMNYTLNDGVKVSSTIAYVQGTKAKILGGKTGYTPESGQSISILYKEDAHSYLLILTNAMGGSASQHLYYHYEDALTIFENLYN